MFKLKLLFLLGIFIFNAASSQENSNLKSETIAPPPPKEFSGQQSQKWSEVQNTLGQMKTKVDAQLIIVTELLRTKKNNDGKISNEEVSELKKQHEKLKNLTKDYNEVLSDFQFRFPEKGLDSGRKYIRIDNKSIEAIQSDSTFEGRLKKLHQKINRQYQVDDPNESSKKKLIQKIEKKSIESKKLNPEKLDEPQVTDQINLVK